MSQRNFLVGSEWLYYKIYIGPKTSDMFLIQVIMPFINYLKKKELISKWFFIRYADPKSHLRIRFLALDPNNIGDIIRHFQKELQPWVDGDIIWKVQIESYHRELDRYGTNTIEQAESIFWHDSEAISSFLNLIEGNEGEKLRWLFGIKSIDNFLNAFEYKLPDKLELLDGLKTIFGKEFGMARPLKKQLDDKFRNERASIDYFMAFSLIEHPEYEPIQEILLTAKKAIEPIAQQIINTEGAGKLEIEKDKLMGSYIHMLMNRIFKSRNRLNEMVCYDFLFRYYKSVVARNKK